MKLINLDDNTNLDTNYSEKYVHVVLKDGSTKDFFGLKLDTKADFKDAYEKVFEILKRDLIKSMEVEYIDLTKEL